VGAKIALEAELIRTKGLALRHDFAALL